MPEASVNEVSGGKTQDLKPNTGKIVKFGSKPALLCARERHRMARLLRRLYHLNCTVQYSDARHQIWCACHNGSYDLTEGGVRTASRAARRVRRKDRATK